MLLLFLGELFGPSFMAGLEAPLSNSKGGQVIQAVAGQMSAALSETDNEERDQDDKHLTAPISFELSFQTIIFAQQTNGFFGHLFQCPRPLKSLFALHSLLLI